MKILFQESCGTRQVAMMGIENRTDLPTLEDAENICPLRTISYTCSYYMSHI